MRKLPNDVSRCAGRFSFEPTKESICPEREGCLRYEQLKGPDDGYRVSVMMNMRGDDENCTSRIAE